MKRHAATDEMHNKIIEAMKVVGNCVRSWEPLEGDGRVHGRLVRYDETRNIVYVAGHPVLNHGFEWQGTMQEYVEVWTID